MKLENSTGNAARASGRSRIDSLGFCIDDETGRVRAFEVADEIKKSRQKKSRARKESGRRQASLDDKPAR
jgi:hypothetical protein